MTVATETPVRKKRHLLSPHLYGAVVFDLDGVLTRTARLHAAAWKAMFDDYLSERGAREGRQYAPFDSRSDYLEYVDGKPRYDGVRSFLEARGVRLPLGESSDSPDEETIRGLGNRKNRYFHEMLEKQGVEVYESTVELIRALRREGVKTAVISASRNCALILEKAGLRDLFDAKVDGLDAEKIGLKGKPAPDVFLEAVRQLGVDPSVAAVVEDAVAGVEAGKAGHFRLVIGVNRGGNAQRLKAGGADIVVSDLAEVSVGESDLFGTAARDKPDLGFICESPDFWDLTYLHYDPAREGVRESLTALGNGYFVTRGALPQAVDDGIHYPGTYAAGLYNRLITEVLAQKVENEDLVNLPNWLSLSFRIDQGEWFGLRAVEILSFRQELNVREGVLCRDIRFRDAHNRVTQLSERRLVDIRNYHRAALEMRLTAENWSGRLEIRSALDGRVLNNNVKRYHYLNKRHLEPVSRGITGDGLLYLKMRMRQSKVRVAQAARTQISWEPSHPARLEWRPLIEEDYVAQVFQLDISPGRTLVIDKTIAMYTSRDPAISECGLEARDTVRHAPEFDKLLEDHRESWKHLWQLFDIDISVAEDNGHIPTLLILRLHIFHLLQTVSPHSMDFDVGIPARGWHGEGYRGHIFWDDLFCFPILNLRKPEIAESLLKYRYRRLDRARNYASEQGLRGALFPWQSGSDGREETPREHYDEKTNRWIPDYTYRQKHVNAAIAYNIWQYYQVTGDIEFLNTYGAEIILEIARMFASLATYDEEGDCYGIRGVMGPDEYHDAYPDEPRGSGIDNNAYTNLMAVWTLCRALELLDVLTADWRQVLVEKLDIGPGELSRWDDISRKMRVVLLPDGIISQFEGYEHLEEFPADQSVAEWLKRTGGEMNRWKMSKQADVLMLFYLFSSEELVELFGRLGYAFDPASIPRNIDYYLARTAHGSTLSRVAHAWVLSRADRFRSWKLFQEALQSDVSDIQGGTTPEGIHMGAMAGTVDIIQRCYTGLVTRDDVLWLNPCLPSQLQRMSFSLHYRKQSLNLELDRRRLRVTARYSAAPPIKIGFRGDVYELHAGEIKEFDLPEGGCVR